MKFKKLYLLFQTLYHVRLTQLFHQVYYRLRSKLKKKVYTQSTPATQVLKFEEGISYANSFLGEGRFIFLNLEKKFDRVNWNFGEYGKLWVYNLNYFEYLNQERISQEQGLELVEDFVTNHAANKDGLEPYPISLRGINWVKFLSYHQIDDQKINDCLYRDFLRLLDNLEYHLLANHLLENAFSLLFGAYYFRSERIYSKAKKVLVSQLEEQVLEDGAHYELSPMYHQIILHRVLDSYNIVRNNPWKDRELMPLLQEKAEAMLGWLENISFSSGEIPKLNDAADGIAPTSNQLVAYANRLEISWDKRSLFDSGYRKFEFNDFECIMDVGQIAPSYQPGHAHADSLQFVLNYLGKPIIVDTGISTYEKNERRQLERSTVSHNTVTIDNEDSSEVWSGFRVGRRARVTVVKDSPSMIVASHNGYRRKGITHQRTFEQKGTAFVVIDEVHNQGEHIANGYLHFHPDVVVKPSGSSLLLNGKLQLSISGATALGIEQYQFAVGYNKLRSAQKVSYQIRGKARLSIKPI